MSCFEIYSQGSGMSSISSAQEPRPVSISTNRQPFEECGTHFHPARRPQWTSSAGSSLRALVNEVSHRSILFRGLIATVFGDAGIPHPCLQDSATLLRSRARHCPEHSKSRRMICSKSSATCGNFDGLRKTQDRLGLHTRLCAGFARWSLLVLLSLKITCD